MKIILACMLLAASCAIGAHGSGSYGQVVTGPPQVISALPTDVHPWSQLLGMSWLFYEAQQSGNLPSWNRVGNSKPGGWRNSSHLLDGHGPDGINVDLSGGFYEAGNHLKCGLQLSHSLSTLALGVLVHGNGYQAAGQLGAAMRNLKWGAQYLVKAHLVSSPNPNVNKLVVQVGDPHTDNSLYWGRPEQQPQSGQRNTVGWRPVWTTAQSNAASDVLGTTAAAMATIAMLLQQPGSYQDTKMAADLLARARNMVAAGSAKQGQWWPPQGDNQYPSQSFQDDLAWGAAALCWADLQANPKTMPASCNDAFSKWSTAFSMYQWQLNWDWNSQMMPIAITWLQNAAKLAAANKGVTPSVVWDANTYINNFMNLWTNTGRKCPMGDFNLCYTPGGLAYLTQWAPLRHVSLSACAATSAAMFASSPSTRRNYRCWARTQLRYIAGDNPNKQVYIVGYRPTAQHKSADRPHHRSSSCDQNYKLSCNWTQFDMQRPNPSVLHGALVGGPDATDKFLNDRTNYQQNEVALDYNGGFTCALAALSSFTSQLAASGCTWDKYCKGSCDVPAQGHY